MFFEELPDYEPSLTLDGHDKRIELAHYQLRPPTPTGRSASNQQNDGDKPDHPTYHHIARPQPPALAKEYIRRLPLRPPTLRILIPM